MLAISLLLAMGALVGYSREFTDKSCCLEILSTLSDFSFFIYHNLRHESSINFCFQLFFFYLSSDSSNNQLINGALLATTGDAL